jgi:alkanesulfonate monooxygenase SsuD/methylene tetrahydromethanopterin reductase-like flavin-dependent oxidoreductase (luciferase family)
VPYRGYQLKEITVVPRPKHLPVDVWMPIASGRSIDMMARHGLKAMVDLNGEKILDDSVRAYQAACARHGGPSSSART